MEISLFSLDIFCVIVASPTYYDDPQFQAFELLYEKLKHCKMLVNAT
jgi:hypothetical protein